ncbi:MAG: DNA repair ATPase [Verrucomicrobiales bacterium]|nr:DNA repair ATPase [Verrucomicrobiales bacterium]
MAELPSSTNSVLPDQLEGGTYEIIRSRLAGFGAELRKRLGHLNAERQSVFGAVETALVATERVSTAHACIPRDMVPIGNDQFLFGYNVQFGLKSTTALADVFAIYRHDPETHVFTDAGLSLLSVEPFASDFSYLYKYYRETGFLKFHRIGVHLYMVFQVGKSVNDVKCFKWLLVDGRLEYLGNRFDHEVRFPPQQEFEWKRADRGMHREGVHPHISIEDRLFVETVGGDLTIKIEDNTTSGEGIYAESVNHRDQTLDDAEIFYAIVGSLILLKILPYQEKNYRYFIYNEKVSTVARVDSIATSCVLLPGDQGVIFADGYHLQTGETKRFDSGLNEMLFERRILSPNGEDILFVFYNQTTGLNVLMPYNLIRQSVATPILCHGYSIFPDGELIYFRGDGAAQKHHTLQVWRTPFMEGPFRTEEKTGSYLYKVGNADLVRCMAECHEILNLLGKEDSFADLYVDLTKRAGDIVDAWFWVGHEAAFDLKTPLLEIKAAADAAISEFDKVKRLRENAVGELNRISQKAGKLTSASRAARPDDILSFVQTLADLRSVRGEVISLREIRYVDGSVVDALEKSVSETVTAVSSQCVEFLLKPGALAPYELRVSTQESAIPAIAKVREAEEIGKALDSAGTELEMLIEVVGNLKIDDATQTTRIIETISTVYAGLNRARSALRSRRQSLAASEGSAQFGAQLNLVDQAVANYLDLCDGPEKCGDYLSRAMVQLEELEGRFGEFEEYLEQLSLKRDEIYNAFESRKLALTAARQKRGAAFAKSADRILTTIGNRLASFSDVAEINGYLAGDIMVGKVRDLIVSLTDLGETVQADDIQTRLKTLREDSIRQLKDRHDLFVDGKDIIRLGKHQFSVNRQELELSLVPRDGELFLHLAGTEFFEAVQDPGILAMRDLQDQELVSETEEVYRSEFLAWQFLNHLENTGKGALRSWLEVATEESRLQTLQAFLSPRYREGYVKGVHDHDAYLILLSLVRVHLEAGLLRYPPAERAMALLYDAAIDPEDLTSKRLVQQLRAFGAMKQHFPVEDHAVQEAYAAQLREGLESFRERYSTRISGLADLDTTLAARYLFWEHLDGSAMVISPEAAAVVKTFRQCLVAKRITKEFDEVLASLGTDVVARFEVSCDWITGSLGSSDGSGVSSAHIAEAAVHLVRGEFELTAVKHVISSSILEGFRGEHRLIVNGAYRFDYLDFTFRLRRYLTNGLPRFEACQAAKVALLEKRRGEMRLGEFKPKVMAAFVRNRLLDHIYLPLIGENLAKQIGTAGADTRVDRSGMLLLVSPPGYGKTTIMEYVANRLGLIFVKINGPALGHEVRSLDPEDAPNASAREEVKKLNFALEMGDNLMLYLDDIQHTHPEFLQRFISLCDAQRKMEGVWNGQPRTYDLRGKKVCIVMAGNPYTESGGKFQIPDMLANRADTYNLGDIVGGHSGDFQASYLENALGSNPVLAKLASRNPEDIAAFLLLAENGSREGIDFAGNYAMEEIAETVSVLQKLRRVRDTILRVNQEYIRSAAMEDAYRVEPPFRLQGSYRNMNRIAQRILPVMTDDEVEQAIRDHYENEAQTLTNGAEANLLKFRELEGNATPEERARWQEIKRKFSRNLLMGGQGENDPVARITGTLATFAEGLSRIEEVLANAALSASQPATLAEVTTERLEKIIAGLRAVPVAVEIKVVPVYDGKETEQKPDSPKTTAASAKNPQRFSGKENQLPIDVESTVEQGSEPADDPREEVGER